MCSEPLPSEVETPCPSRLPKLRAPKPMRVSGLRIGGVWSRNQRRKRSVGACPGRRVRVWLRLRVGKPSGLKSCEKVAKKRLSLRKM